MKIVQLSQESRKSILNDLLKRSPNNYGQYESTVNEIIEIINDLKQYIFVIILKLARIFVLRIIGGKI